MATLNKTIKPWYYDKDKEDDMSRHVPGKLLVSSYEATPNYTMVRLSRNVSQLDLIADLEKWCIMCKCGKRVNRWSFAFKTGEEITMFKLRWE